MRNAGDISNFMKDNPCRFCGNQREMHTYWAMVNPGRRFVFCPNNVYKDFDWLDSPMRERSVQIIPGLLRRGNRMEAEIARLEAKEKKLFVALPMIWVAIAIVLFQKMQGFCLYLVVVMGLWWCLIMYWVWLRLRNTQPI
ncbi:hypothetical protein Vadar_003316 [Vaccinium darrowii]|uniref:Uncharacterized protein n=1 Tax=Vaccinium darrowii TaxID=229202 RepID=A0ACB7X786_9ERIC|nr:hypothetical protein Vadar_003316 [Vaccinium darrowii]